MIAHLSGRLLSRRPEYVVVDVNGVGYRLFVSLTTFYALPEPGAEVSLATTTVVRDDAIHLYGFADPAEKEAFGLLTSVSGVGPKVALGVLSGIAPDQLWLAINNRDTARLCKCPGIGKKTANRLVVELEGRLPDREPGPEEAAPGSPAVEDAVSALINLGYPEAKARGAVEKAAQESPQAAVEALLRAALKQMV